MPITPIDKFFHQENTRASHHKKIEQLKQENHELGEEVASLKGSLERLITMMETQVPAQNQPPLEPIQRTAILEVMSTPVSVAPVNAPQYQMHPNFPWGMPPNYVPEGYCSQVLESLIVPAVTSVPPPMIHITPYQEDPIFHATPCDSMGVYEKMNEFQDQLIEMKREIKAFRGKDLFRKY